MNSILLWRASLARHWVAAVLSFLVAIAITVLVILYAPREYRSVSRLLLRVGHENATLEPTVTVTGDSNAPVKTREDEVQTAIDVMHSRSIMEQVVERLGVELVLEQQLPAAETADDEEPPHLVSKWMGSVKSAIGNIDPVSAKERAIRALESGFDIFAPEKSSLVTVEFKSEHPEVSQTIVSAWVDSYLAHHARVNRTRGAYQFFLKQSAQLEQQLDQVQRQIREAKSQAGFATLEGQQKLLESQLETVGSELYKVEADLVEAATRAESYSDLLTSSIERTMTEATSGIESDSRNEMRGILFQLEVLENEYAAKYKVTHPKLVAIRAQLEDARKIVDAQKSERTEYRETPNPTHQQVFEKRMIDIALEKSLSERKKKLQAQKEHLIAEINALNKREEELARLTRTADVLVERHKAQAVLLEQARLNEELETNGITSINVAQPATLEERPVSPNKKLTAILGLFAACGLALGIPVLLDWRLFFVEPAGLALNGDLPRQETKVETTSAAPVATHSAPPESAAPVMHAASRPR